jgi:DNA polymerase
MELGQSEWFLDETRAAELLQHAALTRYAPTTTRPAARPIEAARPAAADREGEAPTGDFEALRAEVLACTRCRLSEGRTTVVFGEGDREADLLVVGEAPGHEEDRSGRPFVGPAGKLLDKMLAAIGFARGEVFICNVLKCRPPNNRDPVGDEVAACRPYLRRQVELIQPKAICAFGRFAAQTLLESELSLGRLRGARHDFMGIPVVVTYHPAALLRNTQWKRPAWEDLKMLRRIYDEAGGRAPGGERG